MAMKLGTENKNKTYAAIGLVIIVLLYGIYVIHDQFFSTPTPVPVSTPVANHPAAAPAATGTQASGLPATPFAHQAVQLASASALDPTLHPELMAQAEDTTYTGEGRNIFSADSAPSQSLPKIPKPAGPIRPQSTAPIATGPPPPPNIDMKFYGYSAVKDGARKAFLLHGDDIFIAKEGDVVDRRYKVVKISAFSVDVEDLAYTHTQTLPLTQN